MSDEQQPEPETGTNWQAEAEKWKSLSRKNEETAKANADRARRADDAEKALQQVTADREKLASEFAAEKERLNSELTASSTASNDLAQQNLRLSIGLDKGLPKALIERLKGDDADALTADADALLALIPSDRTATPKPDPSQGAKDSAKPTTAQQFASAVESLFPH
jgi:hypothetical protein